MYLSPWDRNARSYGQGRAYDDFYLAQLEELLGQYGPLVEVWFDGANGEGPERQAPGPTTGRASTPPCGACSPRR